MEKKWGLDLSPTDIALHVTLSEAVEALGEPAFPDRLFALAAQYTHADLCSAFAVHGEDRLDFLFARGTDMPDPEFPEAASKGYARTFWKFDPVFRRTISTGREPTNVIRQPWTAIPKSEYRAFCYERPGIVERISIATSDTVNVLLFNLYRTRRSGPFSARDFTTARGLSSVFAAALSKHMTIAVLGAQLRPAPNNIAARLRSRYPTLSDRESETCSALLIGRSAKEAARICGIKASTLVTYRKRAFQKLQIATTGELVRLYENNAAQAPIFPTPP
jgi:DNA-binding CsgD family transcriptional regulator